MNWPIRIASIVGAVALLYGFDFLIGSALQDYPIRLIALAGIYVTLSVSLNLINGITGQFSIGHAGFYMVGAYTAMILTEMFYEKQPLGPIVWILLMMVAGAISAAIAGFIVGLPSLRLKGDYLAIVTLGFGEIVRIIVQNQREWGGSTGMNVLQGQYLWMIWGLAVVCIAICRNLLKTAHGLPFLAVREDEVAAQAMGVNLTKTKVTAFVIGAAFAGAAGSLFCHMNGFISPDLFKMEVSFLILTMVVLGGTGSITGSTLAAMMLFIIPELSRITEKPIQTNLGVLIGIAIGLLLFVNFFRLKRDSRLPTKFMSSAIGWGVTILCIVGASVLGLILGSIPALKAIVYDATQLRMVLLAVTLLVVMLLRPQGMLAHGEFSLDRLFNRKKHVEAVS